MLLEKAFAKFCGSFQALEGGHTIWALRAMTGDNARSFRKKDDGMWHRLDVVTPKKEDKRAFGLQTTDEKHSPDDFFKVLKKYDQMKSRRALALADTIFFSKYWCRKPANFGR